MRHPRLVAFSLGSLVALSAACHRAPPAAVVGADAAPSVEAASVGSVQIPQRGPVSIPFDPQGDGDPMSLAWDDAAGALFVADNQHDRIWRWDDRAGFARVAKLPSNPGAPPRNNVGQIVRLSDGTFVVPRFGFGDHGAIGFTGAAAKSGLIPGLLPERRRIALARADDGALFGAYFLHSKGSDPIGTVTKLTLAGETDYATGFKKPVAVLVHDGKLIVSDQGADTLYALPLVGARPPYAVHAKVPSPDTLAEGPGGSLFTGQYAARDGEPLAIRRVFPDGRVEPVTSSLAFTKAQGVAYDRTNRRIFVADSNGRDVRTVKIIPVDR